MPDAARRSGLVWALSAVRYVAGLPAPRAPATETIVGRRARLARTPLKGYDEDEPRARSVGVLSYRVCEYRVCEARRSSATGSRRHPPRRQPRPRPRPRRAPAPRRRSHRGDGTSRGCAAPVCLALPTTTGRRPLSCITAIWRPRRASRDRCQQDRRQSQKGHGPLHRRAEYYGPPGFRRRAQAKAMKRERPKLAVI